MSDMWSAWWAANELEVWASLALAAVLLLAGAVVAWWPGRRQR